MKPLRTLAAGLAMTLALVADAESGVMTFGAGTTGGIASVITIAASSATPLFTVPPDFVGFSFDVGAAGFLQGYFDPTNAPLIALMGRLGTSGNIRIGGSSSNSTAASAITSTNVAKLYQFMQALGSGWTLLWGLNIYTDTAANAAAEVGILEGVFGPGVVVYQLGNEPDGHTSQLTQAQYLAAWGVFYGTIHAAYPAARFAGPDIYDTGGSGAGWLAAFVSAYGADVVLGTEHLYTNNIANVTLANDVPSGIVKWQTYQFGQPAVSSPLLMRATETNDAVGGGLSGISNGGIAIAWTVAQEIFLAQAGWAGTDVHSSPTGAYYSPWTWSGNPNQWVLNGGTWTLWPKYAAMVLTAAANGAGLLPLSMQGGGLMQLGMAFKNASTGKIQFLVDNTDTQNAAQFQVNQSGSFTQQSVLIATSPSPSSLTSTLGGAPINADGSWSGAAVVQAYGTVFTLPPASAALVTIQ